jgi:2-polyprenyl-6-hydroxyphenyl methylase/3-demethylubiquinone-9 3-methyltransferase
MPHDRVANVLVRARNDPAQYDDLLEHWWAPRGAFVMLHWISTARAKRVPLASRPDAVLVDIACGGGTMAPHVTRLGYRHVGLDLSAGSLRLAAAHGVSPVRADALRLPLADGSADVVVAGEVLEHVSDPDALLTEAVRVLRVGGTLVIDTIARTWWGRFLSITLAERIPGGPPPRLHDGDLFIDRRWLVRRCAELGVPVTLTGLRPSILQYLAWMAGRRAEVAMLPTRSTAALFQAHGVKRDK